MKRAEITVRRWLFLNLLILLSLVCSPIILADETESKTEESQEESREYVPEEDSHEEEPAEEPEESREEESQPEEPGEESREEESQPEELEESHEEESQPEEPGEESHEEESQPEEPGEEPEPTPHEGMMEKEGVWAFYRNGEIDTELTGLAKDEVYGWFYFENGILDTDYQGLERYAGGWFYLENGTIQWDCTGLVNDARYGWFYVKNGMIDWEYTGLERYAGGWFAVERGVLNWNYTGLFKDARYGWFYVKNGMIDWEHTGLERYAGAWFYVKNGTIAWDHTGLVKDDRYGWFYIKDGKLDWTYTGPAEYGEERYYVQNGALTWGYTGTAVYEDKRMLVVNSTLLHPGEQTLSGKQYLVGEDGFLIEGWNTTERVVAEHEEKVILQDYYQTYPYLTYDLTYSDYTLLVQKRLNELGYAVETDGCYGSELTAAVAAFQKERGYYGTGDVDGNTWRELYTVKETVPEQTQEIKSFYLPANGEKIQTGLVTIDGQLRIFINGVMETGPKYFVYNHIRYYIDEDGAAEEAMTDVLRMAAQVLDEVGWNLRSAYDWVVHNIDFVRIEYPWDIPEGEDHADHYAQIGFTKHTGHCYVYASCFYQMAILLGYDAHFIEGMVPAYAGGYTGHGWVEIDQNGKTFTFDAETEHYYSLQSGFCYGFTYGKTDTYVYIQFSRVD